MKVREKKKCNTKAKKENKKKLKVKGVINKNQKETHKKEKRLCLMSSVRKREIGGGGEVRRWEETGDKRSKWRVRRDTSSMEVAHGREEKGKNVEGEATDDDNYNNQGRRKRTR